MISWGAFRFAFPEAKAVFISAFPPSARGVRLIRRCCGKKKTAFSEELRLPGSSRHRPAIHGGVTLFGADVDGATAGSCACNQIPALDAVGHDAEKKYAVQKRNKYTAIFGFAGVECLMFESCWNQTSSALRLHLHPPNMCRAAQRGLNTETAALL